MSKSPARFDPYVDGRDGKLPGPASYAIKDDVTRNTISYSSAKTERMKPKRYHTDAPGVGAYRMQSEFGVYRVGDTMNNFKMPQPSHNDAD